VAAAAAAATTAAAAAAFLSDALWRVTKSAAFREAHDMKFIPTIRLPTKRQLDANSRRRGAASQPMTVTQLGDANQ